MVSFTATGSKFGKSNTADIDLPFTDIEEIVKVLSDRAAENTFRCPCASANSALLRIKTHAMQAFFQLESNTDVLCPAGIDEQKTSWRREAKCDSMMSPHHGAISRGNLGQIFFP